MIKNVESVKKDFCGISIIKSVFFLSFSGLICKIIGVFYRVPLTNILGSLGIGVYQLIFPIYSLLLVLSSSAMPLALSKLVAEKLTKGMYGDIKQLLKLAFYLMLVVGAFLSLLILLFSHTLANAQGSNYAYWGFICIAPAILMVALICVYRGVFQGYNNVKPTAISQIIEQLVKLVLGLLLPAVLLPYGVEYAVAGAIFAVTFSEFVALIYLIVKYKLSKVNLHLKADLKPVATKRNLFIELIKTMLPITLNGLIVPLSLVLDSFIIVNLLVAVGDNLNLALSSYGILSGIVNTLINVPIVIVSSLGIVFLPIVAKYKIKNDLGNLKIAINRCINFTFLIALPCVLLFAFFPSQVLQILYPALSGVELTTACRILIITSSTVLSLAVYYLTTSIMQGLGCYKFSTINAIICCFLRIVLYAVLIKIYNIYAVAIASGIMYLIMAIINVLHLIKIAPIEYLKLVKIFISSLVFLVLLFCIFMCLVSQFGVWSFFIASFFSFCIYFLFNIELVCG